MRKIPAPYTDPTPLFRHGGARPKDRGKLLDFSASINPLGPPESVLRVLRNELPSIAHYPDPECRELTERLAVLHGVEPSQIVVGNGSNELIYAIARAFKPKRVAIAEPTYTEYLRASLAVGAKVDHWLADVSFDLFRFEPFDPGEVELVWLCDPNNPTGTMWSGNLVDWMRQHPRVIFVIDEAFLPFCWLKLRATSQSFGAGSMAAQTASAMNLIVLRSFTKYHALPGLRLGYAVTTARLAQLLASQEAPWSVNVLAQSAGIAALQDQEYEDLTNAWLEKVVAPLNEYPSFEDSMRDLSPSLRVVPSLANYLLVKVAGSCVSRVMAVLTNRGIAVRDASNFVGLGEGYLRMAIRSAEENARMIEAIRFALEGTIKAS